MLVWTEAVVSSFCGFQQSSCFFFLLSFFFSVSKYNPKHHYLIPLSLCHCNNWPTKTHTFLHFNLLGEKDLGNVYRTLAIGWFYFLKARRHWASGAIHHRNTPPASFSSAHTNVKIVQCVSSVSQAPLLKSLTWRRPLKMARNNTYCFIPVKRKHCYTWRDGARQQGKICDPSNVEISERLHMKTHLTGEKLW